MNHCAGDTIFALSSGAPPAAIALMRISGPQAAAALSALAGAVPEPRRAVVSRLAAPRSKEVIDNAVILFFPGPASVTGEDVAELHLHGGRAIVAAAAAALRALGLREANPGEFTRRAFENGRIDLTEAEGLADLLEAETEGQRRAALALAGGALSRTIEAWQERLLAIAARIESALDFSDEADVGETPPDLRGEIADLAASIEAMLARPPAERLRDGVRVVVAGPPNAGKSTLFNALVGREAAITSSVPGTTRDVVEAPVAIGGTALVIADTAGLRTGADEIEAEGVVRAEAQLAAADIILWLGAPAECPDERRAIVIQSKADLPEFAGLAPGAALAVSARTGAGMDALLRSLLDRASSLLPREGEPSLNRRHRHILAPCPGLLREAGASEDLLIAAEGLRQVRLRFDAVTGRAGVEHMLDALFARFCIGK